MTEAVAMAGEHLRREEYSGAVEYVDGWITFCAPCILVFLINNGKNVGEGLSLEEICEALELDEIAISVVKEIWESEYAELYEQVRRARLRRDSALAQSDNGEAESDVESDYDEAESEAEPDCWGYVGSKCHENLRLWRDMLTESKARLVRDGGFQATRSNPMTLPQSAMKSAQRLTVPWTTPTSAAC